MAQCATPKATEYPRVHKIILNSEDRAAGTSRSNATFHNVSLPENFRRQAVLMAASWRAIPSDSSINVAAVYHVHLTGFDHPNSWSSKTKRPTDILFTATGYTWSQPCTIDNLSASVVMDPTAFVGKSLTVLVESPCDTNFSWNVQWTLTLLIFEKSSAEILG